MYGTIIFDLDGTLTNTLNDIATAMNRSLQIHGLAPHPIDAYRYMVGNGARKLAERAVREHQELMEAVLADYQSYYEKHTNDTTLPYPDMPQALMQLQQSGIRLCVLSNKPHADTCGVVKHFFPQINWSVVRGQIQGVPVKPAPDGAFAICESLGIKPDDCLYVGDTNVDMQTAANAGMTSVGVLWGFRDAQELTDSGAKHLISSPLELVKLAHT